MNHIQAAAAMEQEQIKLSSIVTAAAGTCFGTRSNAMSTRQDRIPEPHTRTFQRISKGKSLHQDVHKVLNMAGPPG